MSVNNCLCCSRVYNVGCFGHCETVKTGLIAPIDGEYCIMWEFAGNVFKKKIEYVADAQIDFVPNSFNENFQHTIKVLDPNGDVVTYEDSESVEYDCITFTLKPVNNV